MKKIKDPVSGLTHAFGAALSIAGLVLLIVFSAKHGNAYTVVSSTLFGASLILLYTASATYHLLNVSENTTKILRRIDHIMIYFLIAGSYSPVCLGPLRGGWGWSIFGVVWALAIARIIFNLILDFCPKVAYHWHISRHGLGSFNCNISYDTSF